jgi:hypothetical protein
MNSLRVSCWVVVLQLTACGGSAQYDWSQARATDTQINLQQRQADLYAAAERERISTVERMNAWYAASAAATTEALQAFLEQYPQGTEANEARALLARFTGYRVELAALRSESQAELTRDRLQGRYGDILGSVVVVTGPDGGQHLVLSADMGPEEARTACAKLKEAHLTCQVIKNGKSTA